MALQGVVEQLAVELVTTYGSVERDRQLKVVVTGRLLMMKNKVKFPEVIQYDLIIRPHYTGGKLLCAATRGVRADRAAGVASAGL